MNEIWKPIIGYEGLYEVSNLGRVRSLDRIIKDSRGVITHRLGILLKLGNDKDGYKLASLSGKTHRVHRLVATSFLNNKNDYPQVNHKNGIKHDNRVTNLEWCSQSENIRHSIDKLGRKQSPHENRKVLLKRLEDGRIFKGFKTTARQLNINPGQLYNAIRHKNRTRTAGGYHWEIVR